MIESLRSRISFTGSTNELLARVAHDFVLGAVRASESIPVGFQDANLKLLTEKGSFLVKIFAKQRDQANVSRYVEIMEAALAAGVRHPRLHHCQGRAEYQDHESGLRLVVMDYIDGQTYYELARAPTEAELAQIAAQTVRIHTIALRPSALFDSWAIPNIRWMFEQVREFLPKTSCSMAEEAVQRFEALSTTDLPRCFVHGDIIKTNTLMDRAEQPWILDFAVTNVYPKVQELAVIAANLLHDQKTTLSNRVAAVVHAYRAAEGELSSAEIQALPDYTRGGIAMEMMGSYFERYVSKNDSPEVEYWMRLGTEGLTAAMRDASV